MWGVSKVGREMVAGRRPSRMKIGEGGGEVHARTQEQSAGNSVRVWRQKGWGWRVPARLGAAISAVKSGEPQMRQHCATNASVNPRGSSISGMKAVLIAMRDRIGGAMRDGEGGTEKRCSSRVSWWRRYGAVVVEV